LCLQAGGAAAQQTAQQYKRARIDTLRYRETTKQTTQSDMPNGAINVNVDLNGVVALAFMRGDTARMWYDSVNAKIDSPMGDVGGDLANQLVRKPFMLRFSPNGRVRLISAPAVESPAGPSMMERGFSEWFPRLPAKPLAVGTEWQDTAVENLQPAPGMKTTKTTVMRYKVTGDSTAAGLKVFVIEAVGTSESKGTGSMGAVTVNNTGNTEINGTILFAPDPGIMVSRTTRTKEDSKSEMSGRATMSLPSHTQLESRIELIKK
jgi:hypothetical protein